MIRIGNENLLLDANAIQIGAIDTTRVSARQTEGGLDLFIFLWLDSKRTSFWHWPRFFKFIPANDWSRVSSIAISCVRSIKIASDTHTRANHVRHTQRVSVYSHAKIGLSLHFTPGIAITSAYNPRRNSGSSHCRELDR